VPQKEKGRARARDQGLEAMNPCTYEKRKKKNPRLAVSEDRGKKGAERYISIRVGKPRKRNSIRTERKKKREEKKMPTPIILSRTRGGKKKGRGPLINISLSDTRRIGRGLQEKQRKRRAVSRRVKQKGKREGRKRKGNYATYIFSPPEKGKKKMVYIYPTNHLITEDRKSNGED